MTTSTLVLLLAWAPLARGQFAVSPTGPINLDSFGLPVAYVDVFDLKGGHVQFKCTANGNGPNFLLIIPSTGTTPASVQVGLNPNVAAALEPGARVRSILNFTPADQMPTSGAIRGVCSR